MEQLYSRYNRTIYTYIFYLTQHPQLAEDLLQETFIRAMKATARPQNEAAWLRTIARNLVYDHFRRKRLLSFFSFEQKHEPVQQTTSLDFVLQDEERAALFNALGQLKLVQRDVLVLRKIEGLSIQETALILQMSEDQVKNTQRAALKKLRTIWKGDDMDEA